MTFLGYVFGALLPRVLFLYYWLATNVVDRAFDTFIFPLIGVLVLPWTSLAYVLAYSPAAGGIVGADWLWVVLGFLVDGATYSMGGYQQTHRGAHA